MAQTYDIVVEVGSDVLKGAAKCEPIEALEELVWNSFDADARRVDVITQRNELTGLDWIEVRDNGMGFEVSAKEAFGSFGSSVKKLRDKTPGGRLQHGSEGRGRYKALTLGSQVTWTSTAKHFDSFVTTVITVKSDAPNRLSPTEDVAKEPKSTGTVVRVLEVSTEASAFFLDDVVQELALRFAPYLLAYPGVELYVDGERVEPSKGLLDQRHHEVSVEVDGVTTNANVHLCVWRQLDKEGRAVSKIYFCNEDGFTQESQPGYIRRLSVSITAYVKSKYFDSSSSAGYSRMGSMDAVAKELLTKTRGLISKLNREWLHTQAKQQVQELKDENLYPFSGEPESEVEKVEREVFDIVAEQLHVLAPGIAQDRPADRKRKMEVLRVAITTEPTVQAFLVKEVLGLKPEQQKDLYQVLQHVPLASVVSMAKTVLDRLHFLVGLRHILFETEVKKLLRERTQLHRILAQHLWLFGEEFHLAADDITLKKVLLRHREILELDETAFEVQRNDAKSLNDIPDLVLYRTLCSHPGFVEHLVVELKAPRVVCGESEFSQIKRYARTVAGCDDFDKSRTRWRFVLVNNAFKDDIYESEAQQRGRDEGLVLDHDNYQVWAMPWSSVIQSAEGRHQFLKERLDYQIVEDKPGLDYLRTRFAEFLPASMTENEDEPDSQESEETDDVDDSGFE